VQKQVTYGELARLFIRMSLTAFGGPAAHLAMGEDELVRRRGWLTQQEYLDLMAAANLIPGPNSTETMIHVGYKMRGIGGAILTGACFIVPAALVSLILAILYVGGGGIPQVQSLLWGIQPVIVAIIIVAAWRLAPAAMKTRPLIAVFAGSLILSATRALPEAVIIIGAGLLFAIWTTARARLTGGTVMLHLTPFPLSILWRGLNLDNAEMALHRVALTFAPVAQTIINMGEGARASALDLFWYFLRIGSVLFGSGYVLVTYIQADLVTTFGWLTARELLDSVAIGQFTPGPVLTTTTVVGYIVAGLPGALTATLGVFLPSFVLVILTAPLIPRMRQSRFLSAFLDGANTAVLAAIVVTAVQIGLTALRPLLETSPDQIAGVSVVALLILGLSLIGLLRFKLNATILLIVGAAAGLAYGIMGG
jgi:chromate transporter